MRKLEQILALIFLIFPYWISAQTSQAFKYEYSVDIKWENPASASNIRDICFAPNTPVESDVYLAVAHNNGLISIFMNDSYIKPVERNILRQKISFNLYLNNNLATPEEQNLNKVQGSLQFSSDGKFLYSGGWIYFSKIKNAYCSMIYVFDMEKLDIKNATTLDQKPREYKGITVDGLISKFLLSSDNKKILVQHELSNKMKLVSIYDAETFQKEWSTVCEKEVVDIAFGETNSSIYYTQGNNIIHYSVTDNKIIKTYSLEKSDVCRIYSSGKTLICSDFLNKLYYWDYSNPEKPVEIKTKSYISEIQYISGSMLSTLSGYFAGDGNGNIYEVRFGDKKIYPVKWSYQCESCPFIKKITMSGNGRMFGYFNNENGISIYTKSSPL
jgi:hypothetical protein